MEISGVGIGCGIARVVVEDTLLFDRHRRHVGEPASLPVSRKQVIEEGQGGISVVHDASFQRADVFGELRVLHLGHGQVR